MNKSKRGIPEPVVRPFSGVIHEIQGKEYYDAVSLSFDTGDLQLWVGDTVAISCNEAKKEENATWFPWKDNEPWSAVQVMALYKTKSGQYKMDVRWFWRYKEFHARYTKLFKDSIPTKNTLLFNSVVESNTLGTVPIHYVMGRVVLTSQVQRFSQFCNKTTTACHTPVPVVGLLCTGYFDFASQPRVFKSVNEWTGFPRSHSIYDIMVLRGFISIAEDQRKPLLDHFMDNFEMRRYGDQESLATTNNNLKSIVKALKSTTLVASETGRCKHLASSTSRPRTTVASVVSNSSDYSSVTDQNTEAGLSMKRKKRTITVSANKRNRGNLSEPAVIGDDMNTDEGGRDKQWSPQPLISPSVKEADKLKIGTNFYSVVTVPVYSNKCVSRFITKTHNETWKVTVGDVICVQRQETCPPRSRKQGQGIWHPFQVPWMCCQVLSIYTKAQGVHLEVRWFPRVATVDRRVIQGLIENVPDNELLETFDVGVDISASTILGRVDLLLGHQAESGDPKNTSSTIPTVRLRCKNLYYRDFNRIQPIFCGDTSPRMWHQRMLERGIKASPNIRREDLKSVVDLVVGLCEKVNSLFADLHTSGATDSEEHVSILWSSSDAELLLQAAISPPWHHYVDGDNVCHVDDRTGRVWIIRVGDVLAASNEDANCPTAFSNTRHQWFPYTVKWRPCQVVSITRKDSRLELEVKWLLRTSDIANKVEHSHDTPYDFIYESSSPLLSVISCESLLGPLHVSPLQAASIPPFLPSSIHVFGGLWSNEEKKAVMEQPPFAAMVERSIQSCSTYDARVDKVSLLKQIVQVHVSNQSCAFSQSEGEPFASPPSFLMNCENDKIKLAITPHTFVNQARSIRSDVGIITEPSPSSDAESLTGSSHRITTSVVPCHVDKSALRAYFTEMNIEPPFSHYTYHTGNDGKAWRVRVGDIVVLHYKHGAGKALFDVNHEQSSAHYPFTVPWAVAEIVAIWKTYERKSDLPLTDRASQFRIQNGDLDLEIRWFWRKSELPGQTKPGASKKEAPSFCDEIFETDHIDQCTAASVMAPAFVHFLPPSIVKPRYELGMPVLQFICNKFWSYRRKSIIPFNTSSGRMARARMYSICLSKNDVLKNVLELSDKNSMNSLSTCDEKYYLDNACLPWKAAFQKVTGKLCLAQVSEDAFDKGGTLLGREREQQVITNFLRSAIRSTNKSTWDGSKCPSMFIAGPPGTGKTVSVCSIISKLRHEQIDGKIPDFDFFSLNGMEMRHPFDAYVKLWEAISGAAKELLPPAKAAAKLDQYFSGVTMKNAPKRPAIVLMLDEIDYLVTKKETVLYNFFDWPIRSFAKADCPRLIVIGISNTLNLPAKLKASVRSRLGDARCDFRAYNVDEIVEILENKIQPNPSQYAVFEKDAILFVAKKVAAVTGDIRKALQTCRAAADAVMKEVEQGTRNDPKSPSDRPMVRIKDIQKVTRDKFGSFITSALAALSPLQALVMVSIAALSTSSGRSTGGFDIDELMTKTASVANASGDPIYSRPPSLSEMLEILNRLAEARLIRLDTPKSTSSSFRASQGGSGGAWPVILFGVEPSDILSAFRHGRYSHLAEKQLSGLIYED